MPEIRKGESRDSFVSRCVPMVMKEGGHTQKQAVGKCEGMFNSHMMRKGKKSSK